MGFIIKVHQNKDTKNAIRYYQKFYITLYNQSKYLSYKKQQNGMLTLQLGWQYESGINISASVLDTFWEKRYQSHRQSRITNL